MTNTTPKRLVPTRPRRATPFGRANIDNIVTSEIALNPRKSAILPLGGPIGGYLARDGLGWRKKSCFA
jgi:hypothetical protein